MGSTPLPGRLDRENICARYTEGRQNKREVGKVYILAQLADGERGGLEPNITRGSLSVAIVLTSLYG